MSDTNRNNATAIAARDAERAEIAAWIREEAALYKSQCSIHRWQLEEAAEYFADAIAEHRGGQWPDTAPTKLNAAREMLWQAAIDFAKERGRW